MRRLAFSATLAIAVAMAPPARADDPDPAVAIAVGAATIFAGFAVGGTFIAATGDDAARNEAGWFLIESGFALAPLTSHAVVGEWGRGAAFAAVPTATTLGTIPVFLLNPASVDHGTLPQQRVMWGLFCTGPRRVDGGRHRHRVLALAGALHVAPVLGAGQRGDRRRGRAVRAAVLVLAVVSLAGSACATVPQNRRARLADPMMSLTDEPLDAARRQKLYDTREGAAGGDGAAAGGGCGCQ